MGDMLDFPEAIISLRGWLRSNMAAHQPMWQALLNHMTGALVWPMLSSEFLLAVVRTRLSFELCQGSHAYGR